MKYKGKRVQFFVFIHNHYDYILVHFDTMKKSKVLFNNNCFLVPVKNRNSLRKKFLIIAMVSSLFDNPRITKYCRD